MFMKSELKLEKEITGMINTLSEQVSQLEKELAEVKAKLAEEACEPIEGGQSVIVAGGEKPVVLRIQDVYGV